MSDRDRALALTPVSRETLDRLDRFVALFMQWQAKINLVAPSTLPELWTRHIADSLQLLPLAGGAHTWIDLGSGGGFPGLILACALAERPGATVHLIESNRKKASFLREAARITGAPAQIHAQRIADFTRVFVGNPDIVTARAFAPLSQILEESAPLLHKGATGLFLKGQDVAVELTEATKCWKIEAELAPSHTDDKGRIVIVRKAERRLA
jgi:16S rRNA (guanine527-N7)-methyltransferase